ncbi:MAG: DoxX family membrane protein [Streptosporangiales bacterium]|nr:DoxX family membrane protein [Streptosporangiales bacterium]
MTTNEIAPAVAARPGRALHVTLWVLQILLGVFLVVASALPKFAGQVDAVRTFDDIGLGQWFRYFTGVVELAGGVGLMIPRLAGPAAVGLVGLMIGAIITQITVIGSPAWALLPAAYLVIFVVIAKYRLPDAHPLLALVRGR